MKYLKKFDEHSKYAQFIETDEFIKPNVSGCEFGDEVHYNDEEHDYSKDYLTFTALEDGTFTLTIGSNVPVSNLEYIEYSIDNGETWVKTNNVDSTQVTITTPIVSAGDNVFWRGKGISCTNNSSYASTFSSSCKFNISGNINTLLALDDPNNSNIINGISPYNASYRYCKLFMNANLLVDASNLSLPNDKMTSYCCFSMFRGCTSLIAAPKLPATTIVNDCYEEMFYDCTSLEIAPEMLVRTVGWSGSSAYNYMFTGCSSLKYIKNLINYKSFYEWVTNVSSSGTFVKNPSANWVIGNNGIPEGWNVEIDTSIITTINPKYTFTPKGYVTFLFKSHSYFGLAIKHSKQSFYVSTDGVNWDDFDLNSCLEFNQNETCYVCGILPTDANLNVSSSQFSVNGTFEISGNCNALWNYDDLDAQIINYCGYEMFRNCIGLLSAENFILSAKTLSYSCYHSMFYGCTSLTKAPQLQATKLANSCYRWMFEKCTSLTTAPELPVTTLSPGCYESMFSDCTSLTTAPALPATTIPSTTYGSCYAYMFKGCTSLTTAPALPATTLSDHCYSYMFQGCTSLTTAPVLPATKLDDYCYEYMFQDCTSLTTAPALPATTLTYYCYQYMFYGCTSLTTAPALPATTLAYYCCKLMFCGCTSLTTAPTLPATTLAGYCYESMFSGCTSLTTAPALPATTLGDHCYDGMFNKCTSLTTPPALPATTLTSSCYDSMFYSCTSLTTAPALPATTLTTFCYQNMFRDCSQLNYVKALFTTGPSTTYTYYWVSGIASTGIFVKNINATWGTTGRHGVPSGWTILYFDPATEKYYLSDKTTECDDHGNVI